MAVAIHGHIQSGDSFLSATEGVVAFVALQSGRAKLAIGQVSLRLRVIGVDLGSRCPMDCIVAVGLRYRVAMASRDLIDKAGTALAEAAGTDAKIILFGSYARGEERSDSDFDFLVIEPDVEDHFAESVRLAKLVGELGVPADVVVATEDHVREWGGLPGTMIHDALSEGKVVGGRAT